MAADGLGHIRTLSEAARASYLAISHRRLVIKALITECYRQKEAGQSAMTAAYAAALIRGQSDALNVLADQQQSPY